MINTRKPLIYLRIFISNHSLKIYLNNFIINHVVFVIYNTFNYNIQQTFSETQFFLHNIACSCGKIQGLSDDVHVIYTRTATTHNAINARLIRSLTRYTLLYVAVVYAQNTFASVR